MDSITEDAWYSTPQATQLVGLTFRQLDYLCRITPGLEAQWQQATPGSGVHRRWPAWLIERVQAAKALNDVVPVTLGNSLLPLFFEAVINNGPAPDPLDQYVIYEDGTIRYTGTTPITDSGVIARWR